MNKKQTDSLMNTLIRLSMMVIILGAFLRISHYSHGTLILMIGFLSVSVLSSFEIGRLKKIIKQVESGNPEEKK